VTAVRCFLDTPMGQTRRLHADQVIVVRANDSPATQQAETDATHDLQRGRIKALRGTGGDWRPPAGVKEVAELNQREWTGGARSS
jgi:hypothetical protein